MVNTLLYVNSLSHARHIGLQLCQAANVDPAQTLVLCRSPEPVKFRFPRGGQMSDYPRVGPPQYSFNENALWRSIKGASLLAGVTAAVLMSHAEVEALLKSIPQIVYFSEPYGSTIHDFRQLLELCPPNGERNVRFGYMASMSDDSVASAFEGQAEARMVVLEQFGSAKRYFEWNWLVNAQVVLSQALRAVDANIERASLSKFGLQALYWLHANRPQTAQQRPHSESELVRAFEDWAGTGKYSGFSLGSPTSYRGIIEQLRNLGLIEYVHNNKRVQVSDKGRAFLARLHPGCEDADLPARLSNWGQQGMAASKESIDRYIRSFFGRQLRFSANSDFLDMSFQKRTF